MMDVIKKYKETMDGITVKDSFETETVQMLQDVEERRHRHKKVRMQQFRKAALVCMAALLLGTGSAAVAEGLNLGQIIRERFGDDVSADKIDSEEYQRMDASISNEDMTVRYIGTVGDEETSFLVLELEMRNEMAADSEEIGFGIKTYDATVNQADYIETKCRADKVESGEDMSLYMLMYQIPPAWAQLSANENREILVDIQTLILNYGEAEEYHSLSDMVMPIRLDKTYMEPGKTITVNQQADIAGRKIEIKEIKLSGYRTEIWVTFPADSFNDAQNYWQSISRDYLWGKDYERIPNPKHIELYHNGKRVEYAEDSLSYVPEHEDGFSTVSGPGEYSCLLILNELHLEDGDSLDIRYEDIVLNVR